MLSCGLRCRPPSRGGSATDALTTRRPTRRGGSALRRILIAIPIIILLVSLLLAGAGALFTVAAYNYYASGLPDPKDALTDLDFEQQTIVYDRTGKVELARLGTLRRELVTFDQIPGEMLDATTAIEDKDFWINPGFDPAGIVSAGHRHRLGSAARRLDDHPAARAQSAAAGRGVRGHRPRSARSARSSSPSG